VFLAAAKVGGIVANNTLRPKFIYDNLDHRDQCNSRRAYQRSGKADVSGLVLYLSQARAAAAARGFHADGTLEPTNEPYAIAKIAGIKMVEAYRSQYGSDFINVMPTKSVRARRQLSPEYSHVVAALIRRFHEAKLSGISNVVSGAPAPRAGNSSTSTTWRTPACT